MATDDEKVLYEDTITQNPQETHGAEHRIQFTQPVKPDRARLAGKSEDVSTFVAPSRRSQSVGSITRRPQSIASIPPVLSQKEKKRRKHEKEEEKKQVDINEHLLPHQDVADKSTLR